MSDNPLVSVITPLYNSAQFIVATIESVLSQSYKNWEMILVDDCSTDDTVEKVIRYQNVDKRIKLIKLDKNQGAAVARNAAIDVSSGKYICFLDSDDTWDIGKLETQINFMESKQILFSFMSYYRVNTHGEVLDLISVPPMVSYKWILKTCPIGCLTAMYNAEILGKQKMPLIRKRQDYGLWLKLIKLAGAAYGINEALSSYRLHSGSISSNKLSAAKYQWRIYREVEKLNFIMSSYNFTCYFFYGILKTKMPRVYGFLVK